MPDSPYPMASHAGVTVESNSGTSADLQAALAPVETTPTEPVKVDTPETPESSATAEAIPEATEKVSADKPDKRTREGKKVSIQAEIDTLIGTKHHTEREVEAAKAELARLRAERAALEKPSESVKPEAPKVPSFPDFATWSADHADATYEDYIDARTDARIAAKDHERESKQTKNQQNAAFQARLAKARKDIPDFNERVQSVNPVLSEPMYDVIVESEIGPELMLYLCEHLEESQRLSTLHPIHVIREMGKLEARVEAAKSGPARTAIATTSAKPPIKPVSGSPITTEKEIGDEESDDAWYRAEQAKRSARRR